LLLLAASFFFSRKIKNLEDFFLASRNLPAILVYFSLTASWIGASSILVSVDEAYRRGISSIWVMGVPAVLTVLVFALFLARPIRQLPIVSLPDLVEMRYGRHVRNLSSLLIVWYMILLAASQMVAAGNFLKLFLGTSYLSALLLATLIVLIYSVFGGLFSVVITDSLQFFLLTCGVIFLLFYLSGTTSLKDISFIAAHVGKEGYFYLFADIKKDLLIVLSFTCAWLISPIVWQRIQAARSVQKAGGSCYFYIFIQQYCYYRHLSSPSFSLGEPGRSPFISLYFFQDRIFSCCVSICCDNSSCYVDYGYSDQHGSIISDQRYLPEAVFQESGKKHCVCQPCFDFDFSITCFSYSN